MIVELIDTVSSQDQNIKFFTHQRTLLPAPARKGESHQSLQNRERHAATHASRGSTEVNLIPILSIPRMCPLERAMPRSLRGAIRRQCGGFSMDQEERANFVYFSVTRHLPGNLSVSYQELQKCRK